MVLSWVELRWYGGTLASAQEKRYRLAMKCEKWGVKREKLRMGGLALAA
jgi:hypothetical protein